MAGAHSFLTRHSCTREEDRAQGLEGGGAARELQGGVCGCVL